MRIWHKRLIPKLCPKHLVAVWREALAAYSIITHHKQGYRQHPAVQEFINSPEALHDRLRAIKREADKRGYNFKALPNRIEYGGQVHEWQSLETQIEVLRTKGCQCQV